MTSLTERICCFVRSSGAFILGGGSYFYEARILERQRLILLLDDDTYLLREVHSLLSGSGFEVLCCENVPSAEQALAVKSKIGVAPDLVIVDLFLEGNAGDELSNGFIRKSLIPQDIPYARMTSAPYLLPADLHGAFVLHKQELSYRPERLIALIEAFLSTRQN